MQFLVDTLTPWGAAILIGVLVMGLETWLSGSDPIGFLTSLRQPRWALPVWAMMAIPFLFYGVAIHACAAMLRLGEPGRQALELVIALLVGNAVLNHLLCRRRRLDWASWFAVPLVFLALVAAHVVSSLDGMAGALLVLAAAFFVYDAVWLRAVGRLNPEFVGRAD